MAYDFTPAMTTGVPTLDAQHRELFRQVNALSDAMKQGQGLGRLGGILDFLVNYTRRHFAEEEAAMARAGCPAAAANQAAHAAFLQTVQKKQPELAARTPTSADVIELQRLLGDWLTKHILGIDAQLAKTVRSAA